MIFRSFPMTETVIPIVEKMPTYELKLLQEYNIARKAQNLPLCTVKIRKCQICDKRFESFSHRSCSKCQRKTQELISKTDISFIGDF